MLSIELFIIDGLKMSSFFESLLKIQLYYNHSHGKFVYLFTYGVKAALNPSCANSILEESPEVWVPATNQQKL